MDTENAYELLERTSQEVRVRFAYFYLYLGLGVIAAVLLLAISPWGRIRLGETLQKPRYGFWSWIAMLFSAGMGAGILLRAVQEPVYMLQFPPYESPHAPEVMALEYTFYQWGFTPWAFYGIFAAIMGYSIFVNRTKVHISATVEGTIRSGIARVGIDLLTIFTTIFGLIAAIGLGSVQIVEGIDHLTASDTGLTGALVLAFIITAIAFVSVWKGIDKGIQVLSRTAVILCLILLMIVFFSGDIPATLKNFVNATTAYLFDLVPMSLAYGHFDPGMDFLADWTVYYWAFWLAWAPFTGIFIARISEGRTLRQLLLGVLLVPSVGMFFWFSVFGTSAFELLYTASVPSDAFENVFTSLFVFLEQYPFSTPLNVLGILLLIMFLVTSVDSAVLVLSMFTDRGKKVPRRSHRLVWSVFILLATWSLIVLGYAKPEVDVLVAVQKLLVITSLPFAFFLIAMLGIFIRKLTLR